MSKSAKIYIHDSYAGLFKQNEEGYSFTYDAAYLNSKNAVPISLTLPLKIEAYQSNTIFPFFDGLIPDGWYLEAGTKLMPSDRMSLLLTLCKECLGAVRIESEEEISYE